MTNFFPALNLILMLVVCTACSSYSGSAKNAGKEADKIVSNHAGLLNIKSKVMSRIDTVARAPASADTITASSIQASIAPEQDLLSTISDYTNVGKIKTADADYTVGVLSLNLGQNLNPRTMALVVNGGAYDSMSFILPVYGVEVKKASISGKEIKVKIMQRFETDKSPFFKDAPLCLSIKLSEFQKGAQTYITRTANFTQGNCKELK